MFGDFTICDMYGNILYEAPKSVYLGEVSQQFKLLRDYQRMGFVVCGRVSAEGKVMFVGINCLIDRPHWFGTKKKGKTTDPLNPGRNLSVYLNARRMAIALQLGEGSPSRGVLVALSKNGLPGFFLPEIDVEEIKDVRPKGVSIYLDSANLRKAKELGFGDVKKGVLAALGDEYPEQYADDPKFPPGHVSVYIKAEYIRLVLMLGQGSAAQGLTDVLEAHGVRDFNPPPYETDCIKGRALSLYLNSANMKKAKRLGDGVASRGVMAALAAWVEAHC